MRSRKKKRSDFAAENAERATRASDACRAYAAASGMDYPEDVHTVIGDLIASLLHLADVYGVDPYDATERARMHYEAETAEVFKYTRHDGR